MTEIELFKLRYPGWERLYELVDTTLLMFNSTFDTPLILEGYDVQKGMLTPCFNEAPNTLAQNMLNLIWNKLRFQSKVICSRCGEGCVIQQTPHTPYCFNCWVVENNIEYESSKNVFVQRGAKRSIAEELSDIWNPRQSYRPPDPRSAIKLDYLD